jgi:WD40 repeat protein
MTLGEVLMGLALLSMVLVMAAVVLQWALQGSQTQQNKTVGAFLAQQQMEDLMAAPEPMDAKGVFAPPRQDFSWTSQVQELGQEPFLDLTVSVHGPRGARYRLKAQRRKNLRALVYRSNEQLIRSSEDLREAEVLTEGIGKWGFSLAPGGQTLAFVATKDGLPQIFTRSLPGNEATVLVQHPSGAQEPCYSPDGKRLAFTAQEDGVSTVFVWDLARRSWSVVSRGGHQDSSPCWSWSEKMPSCAGSSTEPRRLSTSKKNCASYSEWTRRRAT